MASSEDKPLGTDAQLAVLNVKVDQLIEMSKARGEDHEARLRRLEERKFPLPTVAVLIALTSLVMAAISYITTR